MDVKFHLQTHSKLGIEEPIGDIFGLKTHPSEISLPTFEKALISWKGLKIDL